MDRGSRAAGAWLAAVLLLACDHSTGSGPGGGRLGDFCASNFDCVSQVCLQDVDLPYCSARCSSDADCGTLTCGVLADGSKACLNPCSATSADPGFTCKNGVPTSCVLAGPESCADCLNCPTGTRCQAGGGCVPLASVGEVCAVDADCLSSNCSTFAGVCRVGLGTACIADNCDRCLYSASGWSFCSRDCDGIIGCVGGGRCLGYEITNSYTCTPVCDGAADPSCPGTCRYTPSQNQNPGFWYCDCANCSYTEQKHDLGAVCRDSSECKDGSCQAPDWNTCSVGVPATCGTCTKSCAADADCGGGLVCARVCSDSQAAPCGNLCLRRCAANQACTVGSCRMLAAAAGASVLACDSRRDLGGSCSSAADCLTGTCVAGVCAPIGGVPNGSACSVPSDCKSNSCVSGYCKGNAQIGDACTAIIDCATGTCCSNVCKTAC